MSYIRPTRREIYIRTQIAAAEGRARAAAVAARDLKPILKGAERRSLLSRTVAALRGWNASPFEHEGCCRAALRSTFVLMGHSWARADNEAHNLVSEGLKKIGAIRPNWEQGQREYTISVDNCLWCACEIVSSDTSGGRKNRYCSPSCAGMALAYRKVTGESVHLNKSLESASRMVNRTKTSVRSCQQCGAHFHPVREASPQIYCSHACRGLARKTVPDRACLHCGELFKAKNDKVYCSMRCYAAGGRTVEYEKACLWCQEIFTARSPQAGYCCKAHQQNAYRLVQRHKGNVVTLTPAIFDSWFQEAA